MSALPLEPVRWSSRRWIYMLAAAFAAQVAVVLFFGQRNPGLTSRPEFDLKVYLAPPGLDVASLSEDPTLLALPSLDGFSGTAWLKFAPLDYEPAEWSEPDRWLGLDEPRLGRTFSQFVETNLIAPLLVSDKPLPPLTRYEPNFPNASVPQQSRLRIEGDLSRRRLVTPMELKSQSHSEILSNTVVQAAVDANGDTLSATLLSKSGLEDADLDALKLAAAARFEAWAPETGLPAAADQLTWGKLIFQWHTLPLAATNLSSTQP